MVHMAGPRIKVRVRQFQFRAKDFFDFIAVPGNAHFFDHKFDPRPDTVFTVPPMLMDLDNGIQCFEQIRLTDLGQRLGKTGHGWLAIAFALATANINLKFDNLIIFNHRHNAHIIA